MASLFSLESILKRQYPLSVHLHWRYAHQFWEHLILHTDHLKSSFSYNEFN